jgi:hypothetical protein
MNSVCYAKGFLGIHSSDQADMQKGGFGYEA